jgi:hypothetical protein
MNNIKRPMGSVSHYFCVVVTSLLFTNAAFAQQAVVLNRQLSMQTTAGILRVAPDPDGSNMVVIGKEKVKEVEGDDFIFFHKKFSLNGNDVVLISSNCGGSGCSLEGWHFLTITPNGKVSVSPQMYVSDGEQPTVETDKDRIIFKAIQRDGRRKKSTTWIYSNGTAKVSQ